MIHAMSDEQNIKKMGGLFNKIPVTYLLMLVGTLSLTGFPFFSAYFSKDLILEILYTSNNSISMYVYGIAVFVVFLTSFYSFRLFFLNQIPFYIKKLPLLNLLIGLFISFILCLIFKKISNFLKSKLNFIYIFLRRKWFFDEMYDLLFVKTSNYLGSGFWKSIDIELIDNVGPNGISRFVRKIGSIFSNFQTGYLYHYALSVIVGLTVFISIYFYIF